MLKVKKNFRSETGNTPLIAMNGKCNLLRLKLCTGLLRLTIHRHPVDPAYLASMAEQ